MNTYSEYYQILLNLINKNKNKNKGNKILKSHFFLNIFQKYYLQQLSYREYIMFIINITNIVHKKMFII